MPLVIDQRLIDMYHKLYDGSTPTMILAEKRNPGFNSNKNHHCKY
jgi:hypothetical protein